MCGISISEPAQWTPTLGQRPRSRQVVFIILLTFMRLLKVRDGYKYIGYCVYGCEVYDW